MLYYSVEILFGKLTGIRMLPFTVYVRLARPYMPGIVFNDLYRIVDELILDHRVYMREGRGRR